MNLMQESVQNYQLVTSVVLAKYCLSMCRIDIAKNNVISM